MSFPRYSNKILSHSSVQEFLEEFGKWGRQTNFDNRTLKMYLREAVSNFELQLWLKLNNNLVTSRDILFEELCHKILNSKKLFETFPDADGTPVTNPAEHTAHEAEQFSRLREEFAQQKQHIAELTEVLREFMSFSGKQSRQQQQDILTLKTELNAIKPALTEMQEAHRQLTATVDDLKDMLQNFSVCITEIQKDEGDFRKHIQEQLLLVVQKEINSSEILEKTEVLQDKLEDILSRTSDLLSSNAATFQSSGVPSESALNAEKKSEISLDSGVTSEQTNDSTSETDTAVPETTTSKPKRRKKRSFKNRSKFWNRLHASDSETDDNWRNKAENKKEFRPSLCAQSSHIPKKVALQVRGNARHGVPGEAIQHLFNPMWGPIPVISPPPGFWFYYPV